MAYGMPSIVEASGLSSVTHIAANPPPHPTTPVEAGALPLVLYIARVPGSRDVFLTPIKPREKIVTAEDVSSSLYYVHVNSIEDYSVESEEPRRPSSASTDAPGVPARKKVPPPLPIRRPAPPSSPPYPLDDGIPTLPGRPSSPQKIARKPVLRDATNTSPTRQAPLDLPVLPRRPLPTPPEDPPSPKTLHDENIRLLRQSEHTDEFNNPFAVDYQNHPETLKQLEAEARPEPGTLTLIRRDPGSSKQWNVASIHDPPVHEVSSSALLAPTASRRTKKGGAPLYLDITNPGYSQFLERPESRISTSTRSSSSSSSAPEGTFRRRLYMPGSRYAEHGYSGHGKHLSVGSASHGDVELPRTMRERHSTDLSTLSPNTPSADRRSKGYTFTSPWEGRCEFTTGATGKSLKCRHHLPHQASGAQEVSELRFNLPTSTRNTPTSTSEKRGSYFALHRRQLSDEGGQTPSIIVDDEGRIDLSLGQERAGGGFGGKQAKLGKLIVEPAGLGMLDLLVAANVGLWWRAYERA